MGRPSKYYSHVQPKLALIAGWARDGCINDEIAKRLGISMTVFYEYQSKYKEFADVLKNSKAVVDYQVENALLKSALSGNTIAQIFWLKNRKPDKWRDKVEQTSKNQQVSMQKQVTIVHLDAEMTDKEIEEALKDNG